MSSNHYSLLNIHHSSKGMTLIEMAVAIAITGIFATVLIGLTLQAQAVARSAKLKNQSTRLSDQMVERIVGFKKKCSWTILDSNFDKSFGDVDLAVCTVNAGGVAAGSLCSPANKYTPEGSSFSQCFHISRTSSQVLRIDVEVYYLDRGKQITTKVSTYLSNL
jgi:prepilin-type N-terminal cleavage/methylation domain-containing protein